MRVDWKETAERANQKYYKRKQRSKQGRQYSESTVNKSISPFSPQLEIHNKKQNRKIGWNDQPPGYLSRPIPRSTGHFFNSSLTSDPEGPTPCDKFRPFRKAVQLHFCPRDYNLVESQGSRCHSTPTSFGHFVLSSGFTSDPESRHLVKVQFPTSELFVF